MSYVADDMDVKFLSSLMVSPKKVSELDKEVTAADFSDVLYYEIFTKIMDFLIHNQPPSYPDLKFKFKGDVIALDVIDIMRAEPALTDIRPVYDEMVERSRREQLTMLGDNMSAQSGKGEPTIDIMDNAEAKLLQLRMGAGIRLQGMSAISPRFQAELAEKVRRYNEHHGIQGVIEMPTGLISLDLLTLGIEKKSMWVLGGGTSDGKTQLAVQIISNVMKAGKKVLYFMLEDSDTKLISRLLAHRTGIKIVDIIIGNLNDSQVQTLKQAQVELIQDDTLFIEESLTDINEMCTVAQYAKLRFADLGLVVVDHINQISDRYLHSGGNREQEIGGSSKKLIKLAKASDIGVLMLQQLNTNPDERSKGLPVAVNDLRDCKSTSHDSAVTILLNCPDRNNAAAGYTKKHTQIIVAKNRYGEVNQFIELSNKADVGKFVEGMPAYKQKAKNHE